MTLIRIVFTAYYKLYRYFGISLQASGHYCAVYCMLTNSDTSRRSMVCMVTALPAGQISYRRSISGRGKRYFCRPEIPDRLWGTPSLLYREYRCLPGAQGGRGDVNLTAHLASSADLKNEWTCTSIPPYASMMCTYTILLLLYFNRLAPVSSQGVFPGTPIPLA